MKALFRIATITLLCSGIATASWAGSHRDSRGDGLQAVVHHAQTGEAAHGWRYFTDPVALRAVVISPDGDYYLSVGKGLRWIARRPLSA